MARRTEHLTVRFTAAEMAELRRRAEAADLTVSGYLRWAGVGRAETEGEVVSGMEREQIQRERTEPVSVARMPGGQSVTVTVTLGEP